MDAFNIDVGGYVNHKQTGIKIELGTTSDHLVVYCDPVDPKARDYIIKAVAFHQFAKELKSGFVPIPKEVKDALDLNTTVPESAQ
jgi:hypothetical protein